jgi:hypothetical protein
VEGPHLEALGQKRHPLLVRAPEGVDGLGRVPHGDQSFLRKLRDHRVVELAEVLGLVHEDVLVDGEDAAGDGGEEELVGEVDRSGEGHLGGG